MKAPASAEKVRLISARGLPALAFFASSTPAPEPYAAQDANAAKAPIRTFERKPGQTIPLSLRGRMKPLSVSRAFNTPPAAPSAKTTKAHTQGFMANLPTMFKRTGAGLQLSFTLATKHRLTCGTDIERLQLC